MKSNILIMDKFRKRKIENFKRNAPQSNGAFQKG